MYGAIWCSTLGRSKEHQRNLNRAWKRIAIRVISAYKTVALDAALLLARLPPLILLANARRRIYDKSSRSRRRKQLTAQRTRAIRTEEMFMLREEWLDHLSRRGNWGRMTIEAVMPEFDCWLDRNHGRVSFHLTQLLTSHGCFSAFLYKIRKLDNPRCISCGGVTSDTADHTWRICFRWEINRRELVEIIGLGLSLRGIVHAMLRGERDWNAVSSFANNVMCIKEEEERAREGILPDPHLTFPPDTQEELAQLDNEID
ncbi:uncharacterized protein [Anoplolepis gracilipes]|uniref:uncharacterized protein n=1 Tax=Anoplolepis gracilipes TaxID=354296 RepID=UPI003B9E28A2